MASRKSTAAPTPAPTGEAGPIVEPLPVSLLDEPLEYVLADHDRQRRVTAALRRFADAGHASRAEADMIAGYLQRDLQLHHADEDEDLFPAVRQRAAAADELGDVLSRLSQDHQQNAKSVDALLAALAVPGDPITLSSDVREAMRTYARREHRHLAIENGIVMVIARRRLTAHDLRRISQGMKARRGVT